MALFVKLDVSWPDDDRVIEAGLDGAGLHATAMCLAKRLETDGWVGRRLLVRYGATDEMLDRLVSLGLMAVDNDQYRPAGWLSRNPSQSAIDMRAAAKREAGMRGNHARYKHAGEFADCGICHGNPRSSHAAIADARTGLADARSHLAPPSPESESETDSETEAAYILKQLPSSGEPASEATEVLGFAAPKPAALDQARAALKPVPDDGTHGDRTGAGHVVECADGEAVTA